MCLRSDKLFKIKLIIWLNFEDIVKLSCYYMCIQIIAIFNEIKNKSPYNIIRIKMSRQMIKKKN